MIEIEIKDWNEDSDLESVPTEDMIVIVIDFVQRIVDSIF